MKGKPEKEAGLIEQSGFEENLKLLKEFFPGKGMVRQKEVAAFMGVSVDTVRRRIKIGSTGRITLTDLARQLGSG